MMINRKKYVIIHTKPQWPLRYKHRCTEVISTISKKDKMSTTYQNITSITKRINTIKYHDT